MARTDARLPGPPGGIRPIRAGHPGPQWRPGRPNATGAAARPDLSASPLAR